MKRRWWIALGAGLLHVLLWWVIVNRDRSPGDFLCDEESCWTLGTIDFPASLLFMWGTEGMATIGSLLLGTIWWALLTLLLVTVVCRLWTSYRGSRQRREAGVKS